MMIRIPGLLAALTGAWALALAGSTGAAETPPPDLSLHEGSSSIVQTSGETELARHEHGLQLLTHVDAASNTLTVVRGWSRAEQDLASEPAVTTRYRRATATGRLVPEVPAHELDQELTLAGVYFPLKAEDVFGPVPGDGKRKREIHVLGQIPLEIEVASTVETTDAGRRHVEKLVEGAREEFTFNGQSARLMDWKLETLTRAKGQTLESWSLELVFELGKEGDAIRIVSQARVERSASLELTGEKSDLERRALQAHASFHRAADLAEDQETRSKPIVALEGLDGSRSRPLLLRAAQTRQSAHNRVFVGTPGGRKIAGLLNRPAPDFTLENLEGKEVRLSDFIRGKVAYLNFWGVG